MKRGLFAFLICAVLLSGFLPVHVLEIRAELKDQTVFLRPVRPGFRFSLGFTHSVEHCPVLDYLRVDDQYRMVVYKTAFWSSRTGLPYAAFGDEVFGAEGDHFTISNMHRIIPGLHQWVEKKYHNTMKIGEEESIDLAALAGDTLLLIDVKKMRLWAFLAKKLDLTLT